MTCLKNELRHLIADHLFCNEFPFEFEQIGDSTFDAVFPGESLPTVDFRGLERRLSAETDFTKHPDSSDFTAVVFDGYFKGQPIALYLRTELVAAHAFAEPTWS